MKKHIVSFMFIAFLGAVLSPLMVYGGGKIARKVTAQYASRVPIVFHKSYDISFLGLENVHPFDSKKYGKVAQYLQDSFFIRFDQPRDQISEIDLRMVHTQEYLDSLNDSRVVASIVEIPALAIIPNFFLQKTILKSMRYATAGTVLAAELALQKGWAINLSGGYHHAKANQGSGFCVYGDIPLAIKKLREKNPELKVLVVDLDAHQGNGLEAMLGEDELTFIFDMYSKNNYPRDTQVMKYIDFNYPQETGVKDQIYLNCLKNNLPIAIKECQPDLIIYNAGTDIFEWDPLGKMAVTREGIIERDAFVFGQALENKIPIAMTLSGGYTKESAGIIGGSITNLINKYGLFKYL